MGSQLPSGKKQDQPISRINMREIGFFWEKYKNNLHKKFIERELTKKGGVTRIAFNINANVPSANFCYSRGVANRHHTSL